MTSPAASNRLMDADAMVSRWDLPTVSGTTVHRRRGNPTVQQLEEIERTAYEEAYKQGREAGLASARAETQQLIASLETQVSQLDTVFGVLSQPLHELDAQVEEQLVKLALTVARHLVRRELKADPAQVIAVVRESVALLPAAARDVRVHLHPEDAAVIREHLATPAADRAWTIVEDPVLSRGGCRVTTDTAQIDARLETRIGTVITAILGEERTGPRIEE